MLNSYKITLHFLQKSHVQYPMSNPCIDIMMTMENTYLHCQICICIIFLIGFMNFILCQPHFLSPIILFFDDRISLPILCGCANFQHIRLFSVLRPHPHTHHHYQQQQHQMYCPCFLSFSEQQPCFSWILHYRYNTRNFMLLYSII